MSHLESAGENLSGHDDVSRPMREGLPPSYRMRADAHYVDLLSARPAAGRDRMLAARDIESAPLADAATIQPLVASVTIHGVLQPLLVQGRQGKYRLIAGHKRLSAAVAAGVADVPCRLFEVDDDEAARLATAARIEAIPTAGPTPVPDTRVNVDADLEKSLGSLAACIDFLSGADSELSRGVANTLLSAEVWRASCLVKATRVAGQDLSAVRTSVSLRKVLDQLVAGFSPERRLRGFEIDVRNTLPPDAFIVTDERLLSIALASAVRSAIAVAGEASGLAVRIAVSAEPGDQVTFTVSQNAAAVSEPWFVRAFDTTWTDRPGGPAALVSLLAVRQSAAALGGQARVAASGRGTAVTFTIPAGLHEAASSMASPRL